MKRGELAGCDPARDFRMGFDGRGIELGAQNIADRVALKAPADNAPIPMHILQATVAVVRGDETQVGLHAFPPRLGKDRGRLDKTHHPFCAKFSAVDVRITPRVFENDLGQALFSSIHEAGHALYEQGVDPALEGTPLGSGVSAGVHESQSRLWENIVARGRGFWEHFYPDLRTVFQDQLGQVSLATFYRAINKVERSLIRTDADEITYNFHVMMRFDLQ